MTATLDGLLAAQAQERPDAAALVLPRGRGWRTTTYRQLDRRVDALAAGLQAAGVRPGMRTALLVPPTGEFFALAFALTRLRAVPVLVDPGIGRDNVRDCLAEAAPEAFVGVPKAHLARRLLGWAASAHVLVTAAALPVPGTRGLRRVEQDGRWRLPFTPPRRPDGSPASIFFTSGSTGPPKGVEHGDAQLVAVAGLVRDLYGMGPGEVSLATFPPFALFGPVLGMTTVVPRMEPTRPADVVPARIAAAAERAGATVMFGSPALLDTLSRGGVPMPTVRRVVSAGAPVPRTVQRRTLALLQPGAQVHTPYGATEALPVATIGSDELLALPEPGICVGRPVPGVDVALVRVTDAPLAELTPDLLVGPGEVGEVVVRGPVVSPAYIERPEATAAAKLLWDGRLAHRMGDLASWDDEGRLWFAGRKAHVVHTADGPLYSVPCEEVFNAHPAVRRTALVPVGPPPASTPVLCVEPEPGVRPTPALSEELLALGRSDPQTRAVAHVLYPPAFPVDIRHNSKIDRPRLGRWAERQLDGTASSGDRP
ncbi:MAG: fatty acid CoA ligase family protein [Actinomycetota bacterium]|nr:fatty acid CoA ligase family protein [Actinomycetota bacterium]